MAIEFFALVTPTEIKLVPTLGYTHIPKAEAKTMKASELANFSKMENGDHIQNTVNKSVKPIVIDLVNREIGVSTEGSMTSTEEFRTMKSTFSMAERLKRKICEKLLIEGKNFDSATVTPKDILKLAITNFSVIGGLINTSAGEVMFSSKGKRHLNEARAIIDTMSWGSTLTKAA